MYGLNDTASRTQATNPSRLPLLDSISSKVALNADRACRPIGLLHSSDFLSGCALEVADMEFNDWAPGAASGVTSLTTLHE